LDVLVQSNSWPGKSFIQKAVCWYSWWSDSKRFCDFHCVIVMKNIEVSWELVHFPSHLLGADPESFSAFSLWIGGSINDSIVTFNLNVFFIWYIFGFFSFFFCGLLWLFLFSWFSLFTFVFRFSWLFFGLIKGLYLLGLSGLSKGVLIKFGCWG